MKEVVGLRANICIYLIHDGRDDRKAKSTKKCVMKRKLKFEDYKNLLETAELEN